MTDSRESPGTRRWLCPLAPFACVAVVTMVKVWGYNGAVRHFVASPTLGLTAGCSTKATSQTGELLLWLGAVVLLLSATISIVVYASCLAIRFAKHGAKLRAFLLLVAFCLGAIAATDSYVPDGRLESSTLFMLPIIDGIMRGVPNGCFLAMILIEGIGWLAFWPIIWAMCATVREGMEKRGEKAARAHLNRLRLVLLMAVVWHVTMTLFERTRDALVAEFVRDEVVRKEFLEIAQARSLVDALFFSAMILAIYLPAFLIARKRFAGSVRRQSFDAIFGGPRRFVADSVGVFLPVLSGASLELWLQAIG